MRLRDKVAIVVGGGQTPGETIGNGRAAALLFSREGARVLVADRRFASAQDTVAEIREAGGTAEAVEVDATDSTACAAMVAECVERWGRIDVLHNNVGIGDGDASVVRIEEKAWDRIFDVNLKTVLLACQHALPVMREQRSGSVVNISSIAATCAHPGVAYRTSKAAVNALTEQMAIANARHGIRVNAIMPGMMNTPMAIEGISAARGVPKEKLVAERDARVPLGRKMGSAW
ncbi:MAG: SDR family NAD(P)-dependent oxidoreductase, partial [Myxococcota bacterium]